MKIHQINSFKVGNLIKGFFLCKEKYFKSTRLGDPFIDLIIADPPVDAWDPASESGQRKTLQEYYQWNNSWLGESHRVLKNTGAIYLFSPWQYSGMYQGLLSNAFKIQSRIIWRKRRFDEMKNSKTW